MIVLCILKKHLKKNLVSILLKGKKSIFPDNHYLIQCKSFYNRIYKLILLKYETIDTIVTTIIQSVVFITECDTAFTVLLITS